MDTCKKLIGCNQLAEILGFSKDYIYVLNSKSPERLPPPTMTSKTKWNIEVVNEWLKEKNDRKKRRPRKYTNPTSLLSR